MQILQDAKALVQAHYQAIENATSATVEAVLRQRMSPMAVWRGVHPFNTLTGPQEICQEFWGPLMSAMGHLQRREDIFFAGQSDLAAPRGVWTLSMGHLMGLFDRGFLGIPPTQKIAMLRYAEFNRVENGQIVETAFFCDLMHLMAQAGIQPFPMQTGIHLVQPGPRTHDGLLYTAHPPEEGAKTLHLIEEMIGTIDDANAQPAARTPREELKQTWSDKMIWWGPEGIGATYTIDRYIEQHQGPFRRHMRDRIFNGHLCRMAEGSYGAFFGWPNLSVVNHDGFMGLPPGEIRADMRVVDVYRRAGDRLVENWIFIDMLHFLKMQGVDVLENLPSTPQRNLALARHV
ncbi:MAG: nuclear transport factor 2 family protein [Pseudomonadota bacterium]